MNTPASDAIRSAHPYHIYDDIMAQPSIVARSIELALEHGAPTVLAVARARRVFVLGTGTSLHAAQAGAFMLQTFSRGKIDARAVESFEFAAYARGLRPDDLAVAVSHSGETTATRTALERARRAGMDTVALTGFPDSSVARVATHILPASETLQPLAGFSGYASSLASFAALSNDLADPAERLDLRPLPDAVQDALVLSEVAHRIAATLLVAEQTADPPRIVVVGGGPNLPTALQAQLMLLVARYFHVSAYQLEYALHGPLAAMEPDALLIVIAPPGPSVERAIDLVRAAHSAGVTPVVLIGEEHVESFEDCHRALLPSGVPDVLSPLTAIVPLQFLAYFLAVGHGLNPDAPSPERA
jgi:glutamine---fructose-6-phosphate transaminase (isomerizing)